MTNGFQPTEVKATQPPNCGSVHDLTQSCICNKNNGWISVKEALPDIKNKVLFTCKNGDCFVGEYRKYGSNGVWVVRGAKGREMHGRVATHWMPLPELPEGE